MPAPATVQTRWPLTSMTSIRRALSLVSPSVARAGPLPRPSARLKSFTAAKRQRHERDGPAVERVHGMVQRAVAARDADVRGAGFGLGDHCLAKGSKRLRVRENRVADAGQELAQPRLLAARVSVTSGQGHDHRQPQWWHWRS